MTNKEILRADLLDILFENRNKEYGAYALRREYPMRLLIATCAMFSMLGLLVILVSIQNNYGPVSGPVTDQDVVLLTPVDESALLPELPPPPATELPGPPPSVSERIFTNTINIRPTQTILNGLPNFSDLENAIPSDRNLVRGPDQYRPVTRQAPVIPTSPVNTTIPDQHFKPEQSDPEFPGGEDALRIFMAENLMTPEDLEAGQRNTVHVRFTVESDGSVEQLEIVKSGGLSYDREVIRVCKKMPRWKPAKQNGIYVSVRYVLPVTFIGLEQ